MRLLLVLNQCEFWDGDTALEGMNKRRKNAVEKGREICLKDCD